ncbi:hypothetical protein [Algoriphagus namhaensis]
MKAWFLDLARRNRLLAYAGLAFLLVAIGMCFGPLLDSRELFGVSVWNKPIKFYLSTTVLLWTTGWIMHELPGKRQVRFISTGVLICLSLELILITYQAVQGKASHFNVANPLDGAIFGMMGIIIFINSLFFIYLLILFVRTKTIAPGYRVGILSGLFIFLLGGYEGYLMAAKLSHTVGASDGQEGLFFLSWAKAYGDLRIYHFIGLHALQVLSLMGWYFFKHRPGAMWITSLVYLVFSSGTLWYALQGKGFF